MHFSSRRDSAVAEVMVGVANWRLWSRLGWSEIKRRYRRTMIGPFWTSLSLGVFIFTIGFLYALLWHQPAESYLPFLASGMISWILVSTIITEGCSMFVAAQGIISQLPFNYIVLACAMIWRNTIVFMHNIFVLILLILYSGTHFTPATLLVAPGILLVALNGLWIAIILGMACARFRDIQQVVSSVLQVAMFVTPVFFRPSQLGERGGMIADINPLFHMVEVIRAPLLGNVPGTITYGFLAAMIIVGWTVALVLFSKYRSRIVFWL